MIDTQQGNKVTELTHCLLSTAIAVLVLTMVPHKEFQSLLFSFKFLLLSDINFLHCKKLRPTLHPAAQRVFAAYRAASGFYSFRVSGAVTGPGFI